MYIKDKGGEAVISSSLRQFYAIIINMNTSLIVLIVLGIVLVVAIMLYNSLVVRRNRVKGAWSDIDAQLKRRYDLIPNLVETVKGSSNFESSTLEKVISARAKAMQGGSHEEVGKAESELSGTLKSIFALAESYPDLKSNQNYLSLQADLSDTEDKILSARRFYNAAVLEYNNALEVFPGVLVAKVFSFMPETFFEVEDKNEKDPVKVSF